MFSLCCTAITLIWTCQELSTWWVWRGRWRDTESLSCFLFPVKKVCMYYMHVCMYVCTQHVTTFSWNWTTNSDIQQLEKIKEVEHIAFSNTQVWLPNVKKKMWVVWSCWNVILILTHIWRKSCQINWAQWKKFHSKKKEKKEEVIKIIHKLLFEIYLVVIITRNQ